MNISFVDFDSAKARLTGAQTRVNNIATKIDEDLSTIEPGNLQTAKEVAALILRVVTEVATLINLKTKSGADELAGHKIPEANIAGIENLAADFETIANGNIIIDGLVGVRARLEPYIGFNYELFEASGEDLVNKISAPALVKGSYEPHASDLTRTLESTIAEGSKWTWLDNNREVNSATGLKTQEGKVRDNYVLNDRTFVSVATDRMSALNIAKLGHVPYKGAVLTSMSNYWLDLAKEIGEQCGIGTHIRKDTQGIDPNVTIADKVTPLPVEVVVRRYLTGTAFKRYEKGQQGSTAPENNIFGDSRLVPGIKKNQRLDSILIDPTTKGKDDKPVTDAQAAALVGFDDWQKIKNFTEEFFAVAEVRAAKKGIIIADTKFEFGKTASGDIVLIDEVFTPDSSRYWFGGDAEGSYYNAYSQNQDPVSFDKDPIRRWASSMQQLGHTDDEIKAMQIPESLVLDTAKRYIQIHDLVTDKKFQPLDPNLAPVDRIKKNLQKAGFVAAA